MKDMLTSEILTNVILQSPDYSNHLDHNIKNENDEDLFNMVGIPKHFCVGIIDIVNSTKTVAKLPQNKASLYYEIFLNTMAKTITRFNAHILKTMGDGIMFYFPDTCYDDRKFGFLSCIECGFALTETHTKLNYKLKEAYIPQIDFRVSFDYGCVTIMKTVEWSIDLVGPTINTCAKINHLASANGIIIGGDLYEKTKWLKEYKFKKDGGYSMDLKHIYPVYTVSRKK